MATMNHIVFKWCKTEGISAHYTKAKRLLFFDGWYDGNTHIEGGEISLKEFLEQLDITLEDVATVLQDNTNRIICPWCNKAILHGEEYVAPKHLENNVYVTKRVHLTCFDEMTAGTIDE